MWCVRAENTFDYTAMNLKALYFLNILCFVSRVLGSDALVDVPFPVESQINEGASLQPESAFVELVVTAHDGVKVIMVPRGQVAPLDRKTLFEDRSVYLHPPPRVNGEDEIDDEMSGWNDLIPLVRTEEQRLALSRQFFRSPPLLVKGELRFRRAYFVDDQVKVNIGDIEEDTIHQCVTPECCLMLSDMAMALPMTSIQEMTSVCFDVLLNDLERDVHPVTFIATFTPELIEKHAKAIATRLTRRLANLNVDQFDALISDPSICGLLDGDSWRSILAVDSLLPSITAECLREGREHFSQIDKVNFDASLMANDVFKFYNEVLPKTVMATMSDDQLSLMASEVNPRSIRGMNLQLAHLTTKSISGLTRYQFFNSLKHRGVGSGRDNVLSHILWKQLPPGILGTALSNDEINLLFDYLKNTQVQQQVPTGIIRELLKYDHICEIVREDTIKRAYPPLTLTDSCFAKLPDNATVAALLFANLSPTALTLVTNEDVSKWNYQNFSGVELFKLMQDKENITRLILNFGRDIPVSDEKHPCRGINIDQLVGNRKFQNYAPVNCYEVMVVEEENWSQLTPRAQAILSMHRDPVEFWTSDLAQTEVVRSWFSMDTNFWEPFEETILKALKEIAPEDDL